MRVVLLLSGGTGTRLGAARPKQYIEVAGKPLFAYALRGLADSNAVEAIQVVAAEAWQPLINDWLVREGLRNIFRGFSNPGENRQLSIYNGLLDIEEYAEDDSPVLIHDASRPYLTGRMVQDYFAAAEGHDGALPVLPMKDTIYQSRDGKVISGLLPREELFAGQAPEVYRLGKYIAANKAVLPEKILSINGAAEPAVLAGMDIAVVPGEEANFKVTTKADLERFRQQVEG